MCIFFYFYVGFRRSDLHEQVTKCFISKIKIYDFGGFGPDDLAKNSSSNFHVFSCLNDGRGVG